MICGLILLCVTSCQPVPGGTVPGGSSTNPGGSTTGNGGSSTGDRSSWTGDRGSSSKGPWVNSSDPWEYSHELESTLGEILFDGYNSLQRPRELVTVFIALRIMTVNDLVSILRFVIV